MAAVDRPPSTLRKGRGRRRARRSFRNLKLDPLVPLSLIALGNLDNIFIVLLPAALARCEVSPEEYECVLLDSTVDTCSLWTYFTFFFVRRRSRVWTFSTSPLFLAVTC